MITSGTPPGVDPASHADQEDRRHDHLDASRHGSGRIFRSQSAVKISATA